jgi:hypothetical protein
LIKINQGIQSSQETINGIGSWTSAQKAFFTNYENIMRALDKGVKMRHIVDSPPENSRFSSNFKSLLEHSSFSLRCIPSPVPAIMFLWDKKTGMISQSVTNPDETPDLWVTNSHLINILDGYFEILWNKATEINI